MTDIELVELAAKALGMTTTTVYGPGPYGGEWGVNLGYADGEHLGYWNPLEDDYDAFRLAMTMHFRIQLSAPEDHAIVETEDNRQFVEHHHDPIVAMRRAIVRAAAAVWHEAHRHQVTTMAG